MKKKSLNMEEIFSHYLQEEYTVEEFAELSGWSKESIRQACRSQKDSHGRAAKLPELFYAVKPRKEWLIKFKKPPFIHKSSSSHRVKLTSKNIKEVELGKSELEAAYLEASEERRNPLFVKSMDTFLDFDIEDSPLMNIIVICLENTSKLAIYNRRDFAKDNESLQAYLGDAILYYTTLKLISNRQNDLVKPFFPLLARWLDIANIHFSYHIRLAIDKEPATCLQCGKFLGDLLPKLNVDSDLEHNFRKHYFCSRQHKNEFDNPANRSSKYKHLINFRKKFNKKRIQDLNNSEFSELCDKLIKNIPRVYKNRESRYKQIKDPNGIELWSREYKLYKYICDKIDAESFVIPEKSQDLYKIILEYLSSNKKFNVDFLEDHDTRRIISCIVKDIYVGAK